MRAVSRLTGMDGQPLGELELERVRRRLRGPAGSKVDLTFERGGEPTPLSANLAGLTGGETKTR